MSTASCPVHLQVLFCLSAGLKTLRRPLAATVSTGPKRPPVRHFNRIYMNTHVPHKLQPHTHTQKTNQRRTTPCLHQYMAPSPHLVWRKMSGPRPKPPACRLSVPQRSPGQQSRPSSEILTPVMTSHLRQSVHPTYLHTICLF